MYCYIRNKWKSIQCGNNLHKLFFELVDELSDKFAVDISGNFNSCFVVLNDGKVFVRGSNRKCSLGMPENIKSIPIFKKLIR